MILLYDFCLLLLGLFALPKLLWQAIRYKKYRASFAARFGCGMPLAPPGVRVVWIHMVSVGETRAMRPLYEKMRQEMQGAHFYLSTVTETGMAEAKRSLPGAAAYFYLPLDFSFLMRRVARRLHPSYLILCEGDLWYNQLRAAKMQGAKTILVSGKLSERSQKRLQKVPFFTRRLFEQLDLLCLQNTLYLERFASLHIPRDKLCVTGNLKFDNTPKAPSSEFKKRLGLADEPVVAIGSTHPGEEELILEQFKEVWKHYPRLKVLLVPRHPERFKSVFSQLTEKGYRLSAYTEGNNGNKQIILIDTMGQLMTCYQLSTLAIVGGSFVKGIGGHNILEPIQGHIPVLFGPYMDTQPELVDLVLEAKAGKQIGAHEIGSSLLELLEPNTYQAYQKNAAALAASCQGTSKSTLEKILFSK